eukprot:Gb_03006 [translate_table: standard]
MFSIIPVSGMYFLYWALQLLSSMRSLRKCCQRWHPSDSVQKELIGSTILISSNLLGPNPLAILPKQPRPEI